MKKEGERRPCLCICGTKNATNATIPEWVTEIEIADKGFSDCIKLASVDMSENVTKIGYEAFAGCLSLTSIAIPKSVTKIGGRAFYRCESLASVLIPESVMEIGEEAFKKCAFEEDFKLEIAGWQFENSLAIKGGIVVYCTNKNVEKIVIPEGVTKIAHHAFDNCTSLISVFIPESITEIAADAFLGCKSLASMYVPKTATNFDQCTFFVENETFEIKEV